MSPVPADEPDPSVGGLCSAGYACVEASDDELVPLFATLYSSGNVDTERFYFGCRVSPASTLLTTWELARSNTKEAPSCTPLSTGGTGLTWN